MIIKMSGLSTDKAGELTLKTVILDERQKAFEQRTIAAMQRTKTHFDTVDSKLEFLDAKIEELLAQKRQLEQLLTRWAKEIQDVNLKDDVMRYLLGDILSDEVLLPEPEEDPPSIIGGAPPLPLSPIREEDGGFNSPSPLRRVRSVCPGAPKRKREDTEVA